MRPSAPHQESRRRVLAGWTAVLLTAACLAADDGDVDTSFGVDGLVTYGAFGAVRLNDVTSSEALLIAVGGYNFASGDPHLHWWSVDDDGDRDLDHFCEGETHDLLPLSFGVSSEARVGVVDRQDRLLVGGWLSLLGSESQKRPIVARFDLGTTGCVLDTAFTSNGWELYDDESFCATASCEVLALAEVAEETGAVASPRLVALVRAASGGLGASRLFLLRLTASGSPDGAFGSGGWVEVRHPHATDPVLFPEAALAVDPRGRLYVVFTHSDPQDTLDLDVSVMRYSAGGVRDTSFGDAGLIEVTNNPPGPDAWDSRAHEIEVTAESRLVVTLRAVGATEARSYSFVYDTSSGTILRLWNWGDSPPPTAVAQGNGRLIEAGRNPFYDHFYAARYLTSAPQTPDISFGGDGFAIYELDPPDWGPPTVVKVHLWHGRIVYGGTRAAPAFTESFLLRATNTHVFADGFEGGTVATWGANEPD